MATSTVRVSRANDNKIGYSGRRVGKQVVRHSANAAELIYQVVEDITDGDNDYRKAIRALGELSRSNTHLADLGMGFVDGDMGAAEAAGRRMLGGTDAEGQS